MGKGDNKFSLKFENPKEYKKHMSILGYQGAIETMYNQTKTPSYMSFLSDVSLDITYNNNSEHLNGVGLYEHRKFS